MIRFLKIILGKRNSFFRRQICIATNSEPKADLKKLQHYSTLAMLVH